MALRRGGRLVALASFFVWREGDGRRRVLPLGAGNTDYLGMLAEPEVAGEAASLVLERLAAGREHWDEVELAQLREGAPALEARLPAGWRVEPGAEPCPVLSLRDADADGWPSAIPPDFLRRARYHERRLRRTGEVRFELADEATLPELLDALVRLHGERWRGRGEDGVLADVDVVAFHREAAPALLAAGVLRLSALRLDGRVVAALYALHDHGRAYYYLGGFDPELARLSPGTVIVGHAIREAAREGLAEFDFLRGREAYKYRWGAEDRGTWVVLSSPVRSGS